MGSIWVVDSAAEQSRTPGPVWLPASRRASLPVEKSFSRPVIPQCGEPTLTSSWEVRRGERVPLAASCTRM